MLVTDNVDSRSRIISILEMDAPNSSETSVLTRHLQRRIPEEVIRHCDLEFTSSMCTNKQTNKGTPWPLFRKRTIPTERPPLVGEI
jgi:hypothetical protein